MHLNMSYSDVRSMPIRYRKWFLKRLKRHFDKQSAMYDQKDTSKQNESNYDGFNKFSEMLDKKFS